MSQNPPIPIGSMLPLSGPSAADGGEFHHGTRLAVEEVNASGGICGRQIELIPIDTCTQTAGEVISAAQKLIHEHGVHAIINGYNIGPQNSEYDLIADAGIIYIHHNTSLQHHDTVASDPDRYFGCFMGDPADYWYGQGFIKFISWLRDTGGWTPHNNRLAIISGSKPYSIVVANAMKSVAKDFGWNLVFGPEIVQTPTTNWRDVLNRVRPLDPAVLANTHFYAVDLAAFQKQFMESPMNALVYLQYGAMHQTFREMTEKDGEGIVVGTVIGLLDDEAGRAFAARYHARFGENSTPFVGCLPYSSVHHYAMAASLAGGTGGPGDFDQNRRIAAKLHDTIYRSVAGTINYHPVWQSAIPFPDATSDPSLGVPHLFYQIQDHKAPLTLIAPEPYNKGRYKAPPWMLSVARTDGS
ncbi:ABC transporter substrate-binding protein [Roseobacter weihaiensis]|uniref:ABC transporter substrate-binding protein n=1 Tax=Roseobacter weihaiensis TaxID=2763262 RepID=UPI001D0B5852|nr:ABC transporter substrate-binding protein [Roseobacter sp. H9]